jgi:hypothetical protein
MDMTLVTAALGLQAGNTQMQIAATVAKSSMDAQRSAVETLLSGAQQNLASLANVASGVGGNLNISA